MGRQATRRPAGTCSNVQKALAGLRQDPTFQMLDRIGHVLADFVVIPTACAPNRRGLLIMRSNAVHNTPLIAFQINKLNQDKPAGRGRASIGG
jgi:hypothetical protein